MRRKLEEIATLSLLPYWLYIFAMQNSVRVDVSQGYRKWERENKENKRLSPPRWRDASVFRDRIGRSSRGTGIQTIPIEFSAGSRSENLRWLALLRKPRTRASSTFVPRLATPLNCHRNNKESRKLSGRCSIWQTGIAVSPNRRETWRKNLITQ